MLKQDYGHIICETHNQQITKVCRRENCNQTRSCCEKCQDQHSGHYNDLIELNQLTTLQKDYDKQFYDIQNKINTNFKRMQSGLESILIKSPTSIKNPAEIDIQVLYCLVLKEFIDKFQLILETITPALSAAQNILNKTTIDITKNFDKKYNINLNKDKPQYKTAYDTFRHNISEIHSNFIEKYDSETKTQGLQEFNDDIAKEDINKNDLKESQNQKLSQKNNNDIQSEQQKQSSNNQSEKNGTDIKSDDQKQKFSQSQNSQVIDKQESKLNQNEQSLSVMKLQDIRFSLQQKSFKITLSQDQMQAEGNQFVLCENYKGNEQITAFAFQVVSGEYVFVGACHKDIIKQNNYETSFRKEIIGHGAYLISSYGYAFSHNQLKYNGGKLKFNFTNSDIVVVKIDRNTNRIKWKVYNDKDQSKLDQNKRFSMQFDPKDDLCPCVYLLYNSKVKISILEN